MTQNEVDIIKNAVLDATEAYVDARLATAAFVKTQIGVVISAYENTAKKWVHTVRCNSTPSNPSGITYNNVLSVNNIHFENNSVVFILAPNAQYSNQFILGKLDNVPYDIVGGSINIGNGRFVVDRNGNVTCKNIDAQGGKIAGFIIGTNKIESTDHNTAFGTDHIGCGEAGLGIVNLVGQNDNAYIQVSDSGSPTNCLDGIRIYWNGKVEKYNTSGSRTWDRYLSNLPEKTIYEDSDGYLHWS